MTVRTGLATGVVDQVVRAARRRRRLKILGPHRRGFGKPPRWPYQRVADIFVTAVELELQPVFATAVLLHDEHRLMEKRMWHLRDEGWLPKGPSPLPGEDRAEWLAQAHRLTAARTAEIEQCERQRALRAQLAVSARRAVRRESYYNHRQLKTRRPLDQIGALY